MKLRLVKKIKLRGMARCFFVYQGRKNEVVATLRQVLSDAEKQKKQPSLMRGRFF